MPESSNNKRSEKKHKLVKTAVVVGATVATGGAAAAAGAGGAAAGGATAGSAASGAGTAGASAGAASGAASSAAKTSELSNSLRELRSAEQRASSLRNALGDKKENSEPENDENDENDEDTDFKTSVFGSERSSKVKGSIGGGIKKKLPLYFLLAALAMIPIIFSAMTVLYPFHLAANTVGKVVNFVQTAFDKVKHAWDELLGKGEIPDELSEKLALHGIDTGIIDRTTGSFIKTNRIIASDSNNTVASTMEIRDTTGSGRLIVRFIDDRGVEHLYQTSEEVLDALETNNDFYNAFHDAVGGDSAFFYDRSGEETFDDLGIDRDPYRTFEATGDVEADQKSFEKLFAEAIDYDPSSSSSTIGGAGGSSGDRYVLLCDRYPGDDCLEVEDTQGYCEEHIEQCEIASPEEWGEEDSDPPSEPSSTELTSDPNEARNKAKEYIENIANNTKARNVEEATVKAAALINAAISANESYQSARASTAVLAGAEQAKAGKNGPINQLATYLTTLTAAEETDPGTGEIIYDTSAGMPSESSNLIATVSNVEYDSVEAAKFSRDRVIVRTEETDTYESVDSSKEIQETTVSIFSGFKKLLNWIIGLFTGQRTANATYLKTQYTEDVAKALFLKPSKTSTGVHLGEDIVKGASFLNTSLAKNTGASNATKESSVAAYNKYTKDLYERNMIADRARRSPFDISSPNTFLGSIINSLYLVSMNKNSFLGQLSSVSNLAVRSFGNLTLGAYADSDLETYLGTSLADASCSTVEGIGGKGDIYCNQIAAYDMTNYGSSDKNILTMTLDDFENSDAISSQLNADKTIKDAADGVEDGLADYIILGSGRESTPGVKDANVCKTKKQGVSITNLFRFIFSSAEEVNESCEGDENLKKVATGEKFADVETNSEWGEKYKYFQGYMLECEALEILGYYSYDGNGRPKSPIVAYKDAYYEANPKDNSPEGIIARRTGWLKEDVIAGIEAIEYLAYLYNYNPTERLAFFEVPKETEIYFEENLTPVDLRIADKKEIIFDDKRNRVVLI